MVDVIPHATTGGRAPRMVRATLPALAVAVVVLAVELWGWWLHPGGVLTPAVAGAAGVVLVVLLLVPPRACWAAPLLAGALATAGAAAWHDAPVELDRRSCRRGGGRGLRDGDLAALVCERTFRLTAGARTCARWSPRRRWEVCSVRRCRRSRLRSSANRAPATCGASRGRRPSPSAPAWCSSPPRCTLATRAPASYLRGRDIEAALFVLAVAGVAVATTQIEDPLVFAGAR